MISMALTELPSSCPLDTVTGLGPSSKSPLQFAGADLQIQCICQSRFGSKQIAFSSEAALLAENENAPLIVEDHMETSEAVGYLVTIEPETGLDILCGVEDNRAKPRT